MHLCCLKTRQLVKSAFPPLAQNDIDRFTMMQCQMTQGQNNLTPAQLAMGDRAGGRGCEGVRHGSVSPFSSGDCGVPNLLIFLNFAPVIMHSIAVSYDFLYSQLRGLANQTNKCFQFTHDTRGDQKVLGLIYSSVRNKIKIAFASYSSKAQNTTCTI